MSKGGSKDGATPLSLDEEYEEEEEEGKQETFVSSEHPTREGFLICALAAALPVTHLRFASLDQSPTVS